MILSPMRMNFVITRRKRTVLFHSMVLFLFQCLAPAFQGVMAKTVAGYTDTLCTMYGPVTVFVTLEDEQVQDNPECYECSVCVIQGNLNGMPVAHVLRLEARYLPNAGNAPGPRHEVSGSPSYTLFLSRAPPVWLMP
ncbi:MAG: hypothetical protein R3203_02885 [Pseudoalteromonas tetraodonis]|nr:hypothetical protein [Pseudoalteromonas tetraodonis]